MTELEALRVSVEADLSDFKKQCEEIKKMARSAASDAGNTFSRIDSDPVSSGMDKGQKSASRMKSAIKSVSDTMRQLKAISLGARLEAGLIKPTEQAAAMQAEIFDCEKAIGILQDAMNGLDASSDAFQRLEKEAQGYQDRIDELTEQIHSMPSFGRNGLFQDVGTPSNLKDLMAYLRAAAGSARDFASEFKVEFAKAFEGTPVGKVGAALGSFMRTVTAVRRGVTRFAIKAKNDFLMIAGGIANMSRKLLAHIPILRRFTQEGRRASTGMLSLRRIMGLLGSYFGFRSMINAAKEGFQNLAQYSQTTNASLSMLKSSLLQLKNALATAFAPILNAVAPLLNTLIGWLTAAATAVAHFMAALTGKSTVVVAKKVTTDYAASLNGAAGAADSANKAAEDYRRTLMGFDEINKLDAPSGSSGSGSGGGGSGGGAISPADMFETVEVSGEANKWAEMIKTAWQDADFTSVGLAIGTKLRDGLNSIPWDEIKAVGNKIAKSIATGLNGFLETPGLFTAVGTTLAESLNTVFGSVNTFATQFHWGSLGTAVKDTINAFFAKFDFKLAASAISNIILGIGDTFIAAVEGVNWGAIGSSIIEFITNIKWVDIFTNAVSLMTKIVQAIHDLLKGAIEKAVEKLEKWISSGEIWDDLFKMGKAVLELGVTLVGTAWDLIRTLASGAITIAGTLVGEAWDALKNVGKTVGITVAATVKKGAQWVADAWEAVKTKANDVKRTLLQSVKKGTWVTDAWSAVKKNADTVYKSLVESVKKGTWVADAWAAVRTGKAAVKRTLLQTVKKGATWIADAWAAAKTTGTTIRKTLQISVSWIGSKLQAAWNALTGKADGGLFINGSWKPVTAYASGGSPSGGQIFIAREAGPELVGTIGGHTAVMNNSQIVASVSAGVYQAVAEAFSQLGGTGGDVIIRLEGDADKFFRVIQEKADAYVQSTGLSPFPV